ncbi:MAG: alpha/beta fold hydrolase [Verrucomicrobiaceae bacterium]|nr:alpha/beta fold hydrolase [Verrucomicrobiaceae bacterium]NCF94295.1 alpha/beta fold hydrolase [Verrucomicrobiaceae bacterium]
MKKTFTNHSLTMLRRALGYGILVTMASLISIGVYVLNNRADLHLWHEVDLDEEFKTSSDVDDFADYLALEDRLFAQLESEVYANTPATEGQSINRFEKGSMMDPTSMKTNWNRTFELTQTSPRAGVLLLHGMSDSPYSLRHLGKTFHEAGASVIGLRIPGHGTAPSGLVETTWKDMAAAVRLAAKHLKESIGDRPLYLVGYSNGGALSVIYATESVNDPSLPRPDGLLLLSPEIGVSKAAALAVWQGRIGHWLGLEKLAWNSISMEYDPFKYGSFAVNAGDQAHRITTEIDKRLGKMAQDGAMQNFPRTLAFQSSVDATVSTTALISRLFDRLPDQGHELILFDINRLALVEHLLSKDPADQLEGLLAETDHTFSLTVVSNSMEEGVPSLRVHLRRREAGTMETIEKSTEMSWPDETFSLSHIAIPFPENDSLYGSGEGGKVPTLGNRALRGERGTLLISPGEMLRQKWNPFYSWLEQKSLTFTELDSVE